MADQKKWFKVWTSICSDDDFDPSRPTGLIGLGRFSILGAYTALHGNRGIVEIMPDTLFRITQCHGLDELRCDLALKNVHFEEGKSVYGKITVTWDKWVKYQEDSTQAERQKTSRAKRRGEEIRGDKIRGEENKEPQAALFVLPDWIPKMEWEEFKKMRRKMRKPLGEHAEALLIKDLDHLCQCGNDCKAVIEQSIKNGWQGLFEIKERFENGKQSGEPKGFAAIREVLGRQPK